MGAEKYGGLFGLGNLLTMPSSYFGDVYLDDGAGIRYTFSSFGIHDKISGRDAVYAFATQDAFGSTIHYIGKADDLGTRLSGHERLNDAIRAGANRVLVHIPGPGFIVGHLEAEKRLISRYNPALNTQHVDNKLLGILGLR